MDATERVLISIWRLCVHNLTVQSRSRPANLGAEIENLIVEYFGGDAAFTEALNTWHIERALELSIHYEIDDPWMRTVLQRVAQDFSALPEVISVKCLLEFDRVRFFVYTNEEIYSDTLLDHLIGVEMQLRDAYPQVRQSFEFVPVQLGDLEETKLNLAHHLYQRVTS